LLSNLNIVFETKGHFASLISFHELVSQTFKINIFLNWYFVIC